MGRARSCFTQQLTQLQALLAAHGDTSVPTESLPPEQEHTDLLADEAWCQVEPTKRKALLDKQRDILAKKVKANLGKVSVHVSPFKKN